MTLKVKNEKGLKRWTDKAHQQQIDAMPDPDVIKDILKRLDKLERKVDSQETRIKTLEAQYGKMWVEYGEQQRSGLEPDGGEEGF